MLRVEVRVRKVGFEGIWGEGIKGCYGCRVKISVKVVRFYGRG